MSKQNLTGEEVECLGKLNQHLDAIISKCNEEITRRTIQNTVIYPQTPEEKDTPSTIKPPKYADVS